MNKNINKSRFFILLFLFFMLVWAIVHVTEFNGYHGGENSVGVSTFFENSKKEKLDIEEIFEAQTTYIDRVNLVLTDLPQERVGYLNIKLVHGDKVLYIGNKPLNTINSNEWFSVHLGITLITHQKYKLQITSKDTTLLPSIYLADDGTTPVFTYTYKNDLKIIDKVLVIIYYIVLYSICTILVLKYQNIIDYIKKLLVSFDIQKWKVGPYAIVNTLVAALLLYGSRITIPDNILFCLFEIAIFISGMWVENNFQKIKNELCVGLRNKVTYVILSCYTSFSIVGSRCFIYPLNMNVSLSSVICFLGTSLAVFPLVIFLTYVFGYCREDQKKVFRAGNMPWKVYSFCFGVIMLVAVTYMRAFNPAISSPDTIFCMEHAVNSVRGIVNWHPPFYILWLKAIVSVWDSAYAVLLVQYVWFILVFLEGMRFLYRRGISSVFIIVVTILTALNCGHMVQLTTIWKDIPYTISVLWLTIIVARMVFEDQTRKWFIYIELIISLVCTALMRQNGMVIFVIVLPILLYSFRKDLKLWGSCFFAIVLVFSILSPLYRYLDIKDDFGGGKFVGLGQDILAVYYNGGDLDDRTMHIVNALSNNDIAGFRFNPYQAQIYWSQSFDLNVSDFILAYINTFVKNPIIMTREVLTRQDGVWNILEGQNGGMTAVNYLSNLEGNAGLGAILTQRETNFLTDRLSEFTSRSAEISLLKMIEWRAGVWMFLTVISFAVCVLLKQNYKLWIVYVVVFGHVLSLVVSLGWCDYRYFWPITLISTFLILLTFTIKDNDKLILGVASQANTQ